MRNRIHTNKTIMANLFTIVSLFMIIPSVAIAQGHEGHDHSASAPTSAPSESHPESAPTSHDVLNSECPVMGLAINPDLFIEYQEKTVHFCCAGCVGKFEASPEQYTQNLPQFQPEESPNSVCPVMGLAINPDIYLDHEGKRIFFCCAGCPDTFMANPEQYLPKLMPHTEEDGEGSRDQHSQESSHGNASEIPARGHSGDGHSGTHH